MPESIKFVYVAGAYSKPDPVVNTHRALQVGDLLLNKGLAPFVPHLSHYWEARHPHSWQAWLDLDFWWITRCDALLWDKELMPGASDGASKEVEFAIKHGIPVFDSIEQLLSDQRVDYRPLSVIADLTVI